MDFIIALVNGRVLALELEALGYGVRLAATRYFWGA